MLGLFSASRLFFPFLILHFSLKEIAVHERYRSRLEHGTADLSTLIETPNPGTRKRWDGGLIFPLMYHVFLFFVSAFFLSRLRRWCWIMKKRQQREYSELYLFYPLEQKWKKIPREQQNTPNTALVIIHSPLTPIHLSQKLCLINI